ncbi:MAG: hypothetical protein IT350_06380, partial [Deltaproteobacteria bacterium]|nr:hypothetical protein [Deltaproteobacteria bacterium]
MVDFLGIEGDALTWDVWELERRVAYFNCGVLPRPTSVVPTRVQPNSLTRFTVSGANLNEGMGFFVPECYGVEEISGGSTARRYFECTTGSSLGAKQGCVKDQPGGGECFNFVVNVGNIPIVEDVSPRLVSLGRNRANPRVRFTVFGQELPDDLGFFVDGCNDYEPISADPNEFQIDCTFDGTAGTKRGTVREFIGGEQLLAFDVLVGQSGAIVDEVQPATAVPSALNTFDVIGQNLPTGLTFWVDQCQGVSELSGGTGSHRQFSCTFGSVSGEKSGAVSKDGQILYRFSVQVGTSSPNVTSVYPQRATINEYTEFTIYGENLISGMGFWVDGCDQIHEVAGGSSQTRQFTCTPISLGMKDGVVKDRPTGTILKTFTVDIHQTTSNASITLTRPGMGETWGIGSSHMINWATANSLGCIDVNLYWGATNNLQIADCSADDGTQSWSVPADLIDRDDYKIVVSFDSDSDIKDDATISITSNNPPTTPTISAPASGNVNTNINVPVTVGTDPDNDQV